MKKNSCTPINPKKYSCNGLNKTHAKNLITKKNSCSSKIPVPPITFLMVRPLAMYKLYGDTYCIKDHKGCLGNVVSLEKIKYNRMIDGRQIFKPLQLY